MTQSAYANYPMTYRRSTLDDNEMDEQALLQTLHMLGFSTN